MKLGILGGDGQVGRALRTLCEGAGSDSPARFDVSAPARGEVDITRPAAVETWLGRIRPVVVVNCAALTNVPGAEANPALADAVNGQAAGTLARAAAEWNIAVIYVSSDYVFDGGLAVPRREDDPVRPLNAYGASKARGERETLAGNVRSAVLRAGWIFSSNAPNFVLTMLRKARAGDLLTVVDDQRGGPCSAAEVARYLLAISAALVEGPIEERIFHLESSPPVTWYGFAHAICELAVNHGLLSEMPRLQAIDSQAYTLDDVRRPAYSVLDGARTRAMLGLGAGCWRRDLEAVLIALKAHDS